ncbi:MAG: hypothetical protein GY714_29640 [Desulfobacterales bacterium]|nr:hypothetical protein [Desulfobacterales bacterium]
MKSLANKLFSRLYFLKAPFWGQKASFKAKKEVLFEAISYYYNMLSWSDPIPAIPGPSRFESIIPENILHGFMQNISQESIVLDVLGKLF